MNKSGNGRTVADVAVDLTLECVDAAGRRHQIDTVMAYRRTDPYAVSMTFLTGDGDLTWTFGRDLLVHGVHQPVGDGDVRVSPAIGASGRAVVDVELSSPDGHLVLQARTTELAEFVERTTSLVPAGEESEHFDVDQLIASILEG
jgi:hypothetical protein